MAELDEQYVCTLSEASLKKAQDELNEDPQNRLAAVQTFRKWINEQPHLKAYTDTRYLLRFLRGSKFSQLKAQETLECALTGKNTVPTWMNNLRFTDEIIKFLRDTKFMMPLPKRNKDGQVVVLAQQGGFDPAIHKMELVMQVCWILFIWLTSNEETQVNGVVYLMDLSQVGLKHQLFWTLDDLRKLMNLFQNGTPGRFMGFHYYHMNSFFEGILQLLFPFLTKEFQNRIVLHGDNLESVYKVIPQELLPVEYLPDDYKGPNAGTMHDIMENFINELRDPKFLAELEIETSTEWFIDESKKPADGEPRCPVSRPFARKLESAKAAGEIIFQWTKL